MNFIQRPAEGKERNVRNAAQEKQLQKEHLKTSLLSVLAVTIEAAVRRDPNLSNLLGDEVDHYIEKLDSYLSEYYGITCL